MSFHRLTAVIPSLVALVAVSVHPLIAVDALTVDQRLEELDQEIKVLKRKNEIAAEEAKAAADKLKAAVKDSDLTFKLKALIQARANLAAGATDNRGKSQDYYASSAAAGSESEVARFGFRRVRFGVEARSKTDWFATLILQGDNAVTSNTTSATAAPVGLYYVYAGKTFTATDDVQQDLSIGLNEPYSNKTSVSGSTGLFAGDRSVNSLDGWQREIGVQYLLRTPFLRAGADIQDNSNLARNAAEPSQVGNNQVVNYGNYGGRPTPFTSFRIEASPGADYLPVKKQESYLGAEGTQVLFGVDYQNSGKTYAVSNESRQLTVFGPDVLVHLDAVTFLAEYRISKLARTGTAGDLAPGELDSLNGRHWNVQAGYAFPLDSGIVIEPALRFAVTDWASGLDERSQYGVNASRDNNAYSAKSLLGQAGLTEQAVAGGSTNLGSGSQINIGVNLYWSGHSNKTQVDYSRWNAEKGDGAAHAIAVQHQVSF